MSALEQQVGGGHYQKYKIQPIELYHSQNLPFIESCIIKYVLRHRDKNGPEDVRKARHYLALRGDLGHVNTDTVSMAEVNDFLATNEIHGGSAHVVRSVCMTLNCDGVEAQALRSNIDFLLLKILEREYRIYD